MFGLFTQSQVQGTKDRGVWQGPGGDPLLRHLFTGAARKAESAAHDRLHTGNVTGAVGKSRFLVPGLDAIPHPESGILVQPSNKTTGEYLVLDGEYLGDAAAHENERREYCKGLFKQFFTSDKILEHCTSDTFLDDCAKGSDARGNVVDGAPAMPDQLVRAEARPSILLFLPESSTEWSLGVAKAAWLLQHHKHAHGRIVLGHSGVAQTHGKAPRPASADLKEAVA